MTRIAGSALFLLLCAMTMTGCPSKGNQPVTGGKLPVVATIFPVFDFARIIGGEKADVRLLLPPGIEPHNYEPKPDDVARIGKAALFIYANSAMETWASDLLKGVGGGRGTLVVEAGRELASLPANDHHHDDHDHHGEQKQGTMDPHVWLDPTQAMLMVDTIAAAMAEKDPANATHYRANATRYKGELTTLDEQFRQGLATCGQRTFLHGGHYAFAYLARRYGLTYLSAYAVSADAEPTPQRMVALVREMRRQHLNHIFYEELLSPAVAETIARETGAKLLKLHGVHSVSKAELDRGVSYLSLMTENLKNLRAGLSCR